MDGVSLEQILAVESEKWDLREVHPSVLLRQREARGLQSIQESRHYE